MATCFACAIKSSCRPASTKIMGELRQVCKCIVGTVATQEMEQIFTLADNSVPLTKSKLLIDTVAQQPSIYAEYIGTYFIYVVGVNIVL